MRFSMPRWPATSTSSGLKMKRSVSKFISLTTFGLVVIAISLIITMLAAGARLDGNDHAGDMRVDGGSNHLVTFTAPFADFNVTWPNGTVTKNKNIGELNWVFTWHLSAVAAAPSLLDEENGPVVLQSSPSKPFNITDSLFQVALLFNSSLDWAVINPDSYNYSDRPTLTSETVQGVHMGNVNMAASGALWAIELGAILIAAILFIFHPCCVTYSSTNTVRNMHYERLHRRRLRSIAGLLSVAIFFGLIFVSYITAKAVWVVHQLKQGGNENYLYNVKFGHKGITLLWCSWAALVLAFGLVVLLSFEDKGFGEDLYREGAVSLRQTENANRTRDDEIVHDPPPPYAVASADQPPKPEDDNENQRET